jgi:small-conductance mechanosensitive channel
LATHGGGGGATLTAFGLKVLGAIVAWIVGRYLVGLALRLIGVALTRQEVDPTLRPYTHTDHYWQVYFDTNKAIADAFGAAGYPVPEEHLRMRSA